jgi:hypothetical protein
MTWNRPPHRSCKDVGCFWGNCFVVGSSRRWKGRNEFAGTYCYGNAESVKLKGLYVFVYFLSDCPLPFPNGRHFHSGAQTGPNVIDSDCPKIFTNSVVQQSSNVLL